MNLVIICLCAEWCGTCREFRTIFDMLGKELPDYRFEWYDIEDMSDSCGDIDVETFPTILIHKNHTDLLFAGPIAPHHGTLSRLCQAAINGDLNPLQDHGQWGTLLDVKK